MKSYTKNEELGKEKKVMGIQHVVIKTNHSVSNDATKPIWDQFWITWFKWIAFSPCNEIVLRW